MSTLGSVASTLDKIAQNLPALSLRDPTHSALKTMEDVAQGAKAMLDKSRRAVAMGNELVKTIKEEALTDAVDLLGQMKEHEKRCSEAVKKLQGLLV